MGLKVTKPMIITVLPQHFKTKDDAEAWVHFNAGALPSPRFLNDVTVKAAEDVLHSLMGTPLHPPSDFLRFSPKMALVRTFRGSFPP